MRVSQTQSSTHVSNTIQTEQDPSLNTTSNDQLLQNLIERKRLDPTAVNNEVMTMILSLRLWQYIQKDKWRHSHYCHQ